MKNVNTNKLYVFPMILSWIYVSVLSQTVLTPLNSIDGMIFVKEV
jgi:hypothetical protein